MTFVPSPMLDLCKLIADCQFQQEDLKPHAVVIHDAGKLWCFFRKGDGTYAAMTEQVSIGEQALKFASKEQVFVKNCLPSIISKTIFSGTKNIAFLDMETRWDHERLLEDWAKSQNGTTRDQDIFVRAFRIDGSNRPMKTAEAKLTRTEREPPTAPEPKPKPAPPATLPYSPQYQFQLDEIKDIPAEFMSFVWKSRRVSTGGNAPTEAWDCLRQAERSLTTREVAERVRSKPFASEALSINEVLSVYRDLCAGVNRHLVVPMIGFDQGWLSATSHLAGYSDLSTYHLGTEDLASLRRRKYKTLALGRQNGQGRLTTTVQRCLKSAYTGLRLLDLTEDVICSLTGKTRVVLSLADVCRIHSLVEERHVPS